MTRILIIYQSKPAIVPGLEKGFQNAGLETISFLANEYHHWIDKYIFHAINKWAHNLRILKKGSAAPILRISKAAEIAINKSNAES
jgi:hypothetical protein